MSMLMTKPFKEYKPGGTAQMFNHIQLMMFRHLEYPRHLHRLDRYNRGVEVYWTNSNWPGKLSGHLRCVCAGK